jgi:hypothetical protein
MKKISVNKKTLYVVESHNQVLEAWESCTRQNVFSLDFHTDSREAFQNYSYWKADSEIKSGLYRDHEKRKKEIIDQKINQYLEKEITIKQINDNLKNDEHLDFSVRVDMIDTVFILSKNSNASSSNPNVYIIDGRNNYRNQRILEYSPPCIPGCEKSIHDEKCRYMRADSSLEDFVLDTAIARAKNFKSSFFENYILDIDCDFFNTEKSLYPENFETFENKIREYDFI